MIPQPLPWCDPLLLAQNIRSEPMVLLHSSAHTDYSGRYSLLAVDLEEQIDLENFDVFAPKLRKDQPRYAHCWFGYFGYELKHACERYQPANAGRTTLPKGRLMRFAAIYVFDHEAHSLTLWSQYPRPLPPLQPITPEKTAELTDLSSNMTRAEYEHKVRHILGAIHAGELYQANLTRKFYGTWREAPDGLALFARLCAESPAPYSAYLRMKEAEILSSSPELFLRIDENGSVTTRPIKGSAPRGATPEADATLRAQLEQSAKNRSENLMITDLMRNDLARSCDAGSIHTSDLFAVTTHATIHHMASTVRGQLAAGNQILNAIQGCFPPGSMTGAPKIRAVELCNQLEGVERGVYSGALGWLGGDGSGEFSVVIRTLIMNDKNFEFQVGGGIVADSTPEGEWRETIDKAMGILRMLEVPRERLEAL